MPFAVCFIVDRRLLRLEFFEFLQVLQYTTIDGRKTANVGKNIHLTTGYTVLVQRPASRSVIGCGLEPQPGQTICTKTCLQNCYPRLLHLSSAFQDGVERGNFKPLSKRNGNALDSITLRYFRISSMVQSPPWFKRTHTPYLSPFGLSGAEHGYMMTKMLI